MTYTEAIKFLDGLVNYEKLTKPRDEFKLDNICRLLELAGNPQKRMKEVILVAGTKGKGSVCYMLDAALRGCGLSTGLFVSPHVFDVRERIQLDGESICGHRFADLVSRLAPFVGVPASSGIRHSGFGLRHSVVPVSYFEFTTAMAFLLFADKQPDYSIIEVGLGGRLDATNLCDPKVSVITRIGYDHLKVLGNTLRKIAGEKAGIMRAGRPVVISEQVPEVRRALESRAKAIGARLIRAPAVVSVPSVQCVASGVNLRARGTLGAGGIRLPLLGRHQVENCRTALAVLGELAKDDPRIRFSRAACGLKTVSIPARCQVVLPLSRAPRPAPLVIVDSCHNPESGRALANVLRDHLRFRRSVPRPSSRAPRPRSKVILIYGSLGGKLVTRTVAPLKPYVAQAILVRPDSPRAMPVSELKRVFTRLRVPHVTADSVPAALALTRKSAICNLKSAMPVVVAGSFYLAGEALRALGSSRLSKTRVPKPHLK